MAGLSGEMVVTRKVDSASVHKICGCVVNWLCWCGGHNSLAYKLYFFL